MMFDLKLLFVILAAVAAAFAAGWWMGRRRAAALEAERSLSIDRAMEQLDRRFDDLAGRQLRENIDNFLRLARENLGGHQQHAQASLKEREQAIEALVKPIQETLARTSEALREIEVERQRDFGSLRQHLTDMRDSHSALQRETRNLVQALSKPQVRGQWGEIALRRLVELAGMTAHCDFEEQVHVVGSEGALRPDMVVHLPEGRDIVVDVKTPLDAYLTAAEAPSDEVRAAALKRHAQHVADRVRMLSSKNYAAQFSQGAPVRRAVPARRPVPVGGSRPAARPAGPGDEQQHHPHDSFDAARAPEDRLQRLAERPARRERGTHPRPRRRPLRAPGHVSQSHGKDRQFVGGQPHGLQCGRGIARAQRAARARESSSNSACGPKSRSRNSNRSRLRHA